MEVRSLIENENRRRRIVIVKRQTAVIAGAEPEPGSYLSASCADKSLGTGETESIEVLELPGSIGWVSASDSLLSCVQHGVVDVVVVEDLTRVDCRTDKIVQFLDLCKANGVRVITLNGDIDTGRPSVALRMLMDLSPANAPSPA